MKKETDSEINALKDQIEALTEQLAAAQDQRLRALADCQNIKKRTTAQVLDMQERANEALLEKILPVVDDIERAQEHLNDNGLAGILKQLHQVLAGEGLSVIECEDADFNPHTMECVDVVPGPKDKVIRIVSKGYSHHDKVLRPATVVVGNGEISSEVEESLK